MSQTSAVCATPQEFKGRTLAADWSLAKAAYTSQAAVEGPASHEGETYGSTTAAAASQAQDTPAAAAAKNVQKEANGGVEAASGEAMIVGALTGVGDISEDESSGEEVEEDLEHDEDSSSNEGGDEGNAGWGSSSDEEEEEGSVPQDDDDDDEEETDENGEELEDGTGDQAEVEVGASEAVSRAEREMLARVLQSVVGVSKPGRSRLVGGDVTGEDVAVETRGQHAVREREKESEGEKNRGSQVKDSACVQPWEAGRSKVPTHERGEGTGVIKTQVFVRNVPLDANTIDLQTRLQRFGAVKACRCDPLLLCLLLRLLFARALRHR